MTVFVERRAGTVVGVYACQQPGIAEEELADDHADVVAFRAPRPAETPAEAVERRAVDDPFMRGLVRALAQRFSMTTRELIDAIKAVANGQQGGGR